MWFGTISRIAAACDVLPGRDPVAARNTCRTLLYMCHQSIGAIVGANGDVVADDPPWSTDQPEQTFNREEYLREGTGSAAMISAPVGGCDHRAADHGKDRSTKARKGARRFHLH